jgi:hypothetical protein
MAKRTVRSGTTETFSVSVDRETKAILRDLADREFAGNMSALVKDFAAEASRRKAAGDYLRRHGLVPLTRTEAARASAEIEAELRAAKPRKSA